MNLTTASSRNSSRTLRGWPLFIALSLLFHLLLFMLLYLLTPERMGQDSTAIAPIAVQLQPASQPAKVLPTAAPRTAPPVAKQTARAIRPKSVSKPAARTPARPAQTVLPPPVPERYDERNLGTSQRLLDTFPGAEAPPPAAPAQEGQKPDTESRLEIELQIRNRFAEHFVYPRMAQLHGWQGEVLLSFLVDSEGNISHIQVARGSGHAVLDQAAIDSMSAIHRIEFTPGTVLHGSIEFHMPVIYHLAQG